MSAVRPYLIVSQCLSESAMLISSVYSFSWQCGWEVMDVDVEEHGSHH